tara:strand:+ start:563 stop:799 length:237 start_codon:yes stop_codon:yes gene_type:complete
MSDKMKSRKLWLSLLAALLPIAAKHFFPALPTEVIITSVVGAVAGVLGISMEDVAKQKRAAVEAATGNLPAPSDQPEA